MKATLVIFSGLPGTGKTSLACAVASRLKIPLLRIDDIVAFIPEPMRLQADPFWETMIGIMLNIAEVQLEIGVSVVIDSVFMGEDRKIAQEIAKRQNVKFRPIYTYISDEKIWHERVAYRAINANPEDKVATWESIQQQRKWFAPWKIGSALFVDGISSLEKNIAKVLEYVSAEEIELEEV